MDHNKKNFLARLAPWVSSLAVSLLLFAGVIISGRAPVESPSVVAVSGLEQVVLPPPPVVETVSPEQMELSAMPLKIDFHDVSSKESIALLDVKIAPEMDRDLLEDIKFDLNSVEVMTEDLSSSFVYEQSEVDDPPVPLFQPFPMLPNKLKIKSDQRVRVMFYVDDKGLVESPYVLESSDPELNELVLKTLLKWKYQPAKKNSKPVCCWVRTSLILYAGKKHSPFNV